VRQQIRRASRDGGFEFDIACDCLTFSMSMSPTLTASSSRDARANFEFVGAVTDIVATPPGTTRDPKSERASSSNLDLATQHIGVFWA